MTLHVIKLPDVGEGVAEAEIVEWHVSPGDDVTEDQVLAAVMTDKATVEIPSPVSGTVVERGAEVGTVVAVGSGLVTLRLGGAAAAADGAASETPEVSGGAQEIAVREAPPRQAVRSPAPSNGKRPEHPAPQPDSDTRGKPLASPAVRRRALELGVDLRQVRGTGPAGRIGHEDLDGHIAGDTPARQPVSLHSEIEEIRLSGLRRRIAERMAEATRRIAHFSYIEEVDMTSIEELRQQLNERHGAGRGKLTVLPFILRAVVRAVEEFPQMNALFDDEAEIIVRHRAVHAGIATQTPAGLMVPVLRDAESRDLWASAAEIRRLAAAARDGSARREELSGSTISITSLGELGGIATTPVINRPEVAIVGVNRMAVRPQWRDGGFVPRRMMNLSSSFDHRVIDGHDAALFVQRIRGLLETPATLFL